jgi:hypothetical protein
MTVIIDTEKYLKLKLEGSGIKFPPEILSALAFSMKAGLEEEILCVGGLSLFNKTLPLSVFEDVDCIEIKSSETDRYERYVNLENLEGFIRSVPVIFI